MADRLTELTLAAQKALFRLAERDHDINRKNVAADSGIHYDTLGTYWRGETVMPLSAFLRLVDVIPDYLLSRLLAPVNRRLEVESEGNGNLDDLAREAACFVAEYVEAKSHGKVTPLSHNILLERAAATRDAALRVKP